MEIEFYGWREEKNIGCRGDFLASANKEISGKNVKDVKNVLKSIFDHRFFYFNILVYLLYHTSFSLVMFL